MPVCELITVPARCTTVFGARFFSVRFSPASTVAAGPVWKERSNDLQSLAKRKRVTAS
jgi:hypothetical protein